MVDHWPVMGPAAFQGIAGEIVRRADPQTEGDPVATLIQFLVAFGNLIGRTPHFVVGATRHALNLFCALVGPTALGRKGTSWDLVRYLLQPCDPQWADARILGGLVSGEGLIYHVRDASTKTTKKGEEVVDEGVPDKRLLVLETEMSRTFKAMNRESNTLSDVIRQAWDSGDLPDPGQERPREGHRRPHRHHLPCHPGRRPPPPDRDRQRQRLRQPLPLAGRPPLQAPPRRRRPRRRRLGGDPPQDGTDRRRRPAVPADDPRRAGPRHLARASTASSPPASPGCWGRSSAAPNPRRCGWPASMPSSMGRASSGGSTWPRRWRSGSTARRRPGSSSAPPTATPTPRSSWPPSARRPAGSPARRSRATSSRAIASGRRSPRCSPSC